MPNKKTYAAYARDDDLRLNSSSGAIFSVIANKVLSNGGIVYGVSLSADCRQAEFIRIDTLKDLSKIRGSKYVQAKIGNTFLKIKNDLEQKKQVLVSGTGCQINGLMGVLGRKYDNLICIDIVCHGVPSPGLWKKYVNYIEKKTRASLKHVNFRSKMIGWSEYGICVRSKKKVVYFSPFGKDSYMKMFLSNCSLRPSCYECRAKTFRDADITLADFWGIDDIAPELNDNKGISMVITRTEKGETVFKELGNTLVCKEVAYSDAVKDNPAEYCSVELPEIRREFFENYKSMSFQQLEKKYTPVSLKQKVKQLLMMTLINRYIRGGS